MTVNFPAVSGRSISTWRNLEGSMWASGDKRNLPLPLGWRCFRCCSRSELGADMWPRDEDNPAWLPRIGGLRPYGLALAVFDSGFGAAPVGSN